MDDQDQKDTLDLIEEMNQACVLDHRAIQNE
jgi:hypothetical protein